MNSLTIEKDIIASNYCELLMNIMDTPLGEGEVLDPNILERVKTILNTYIDSKYNTDSEQNIEDACDLIVHAIYQNHYEIFTYVLFSVPPTLLNYQQLFNIILAILYCNRSKFFEFVISEDYFDRLKGVPIQLGRSCFFRTEDGSTNFDINQFPDLLYSEEEVRYAIETNNVDEVRGIIAQGVVDMGHWLYYAALVGNIQIVELFKDSMGHHTRLDVSGTMENPIVISDSETETDTDTSIETASSNASETDSFSSVESSPLQKPPYLSLKPLDELEFNMGHESRQEYAFDIEAQEECTCSTGHEGCGFEWTTDTDYYLNE